DFSTSISEARHGLFGSILLNTSDVCPRMLVSALLKSSETVRANCSAQSSFCFNTRPFASVAAGLISDAGAGGVAGFPSLIQFSNNEAYDFFLKYQGTVTKAEGSNSCTVNSRTCFKSSLSATNTFASGAYSRSN